MSNLDNDFTLPPFPAFPCATRFVEVGTVNESLQRLVRSISARESISTVIGPPGTGKTLLGGILAQRFRETHDIVSLGDAPIANEESLHRQIASQLRLDSSGSETECVIEIIEHLSVPSGKSGGMLLIIDEAQSLSEDLLESIRLLTNTMRDGQPRVSVVLIGGVKLDETLTSPSLSAITQRIGARCYLHPLNAGETRDYVFRTIEDCGAEPSETISDEAVASLHHACNGVPRMINQLMTEAIDCAAEAETNLIDDQIMDRAWAKLQQLPSPMIEEPRFSDTAPTSETSVVEFGSLQPLSNESAPANSNSDEITDAVPSIIAETLEPAICQQPQENCESECEVSGTECTPATDAPSEIEQESIQSLSWDDPSAMPLPAEMFTDVIFENENPQGSEDHIQTIEPDSHIQTAYDKPLFGEFDDEEQIEVGRVSQLNPNQSRKSTPQPEIASAPTSDSTTDLESMLHSEIVSLSSFAADTIQLQSEDIAQSSSHSDSTNDAPIVELETEINDGCNVASSESNGEVFWYDEPAEQPKRYDDDRDIVMISEDVPVETPVPTTRIDESQSGLSLDYQEILAKMRNVKST